jgi:hypothetical protein
MLFGFPAALPTLGLAVLDFSGVGAAGLRAIAPIAVLLEGLLAVAPAADYVRGILRFFEWLRGPVPTRVSTLGVPEVFVFVESGLGRTASSSS